MGFNCHSGPVQKVRATILSEAIDANPNSAEIEPRHYDIIIIRYGCLLSQAFLPGTSLEPAVIPTTQASSFTLQYFPYYV